MPLSPDSGFSYVVGYKKIGFNTYELTLGCGHKIIRVPYNGWRLPERIICPDCYKQTHDKKGNKLNEN